MDPIGGINPSNQRLDTAAPQPQNQIDGVLPGTQPVAPQAAYAPVQPQQQIPDNLIDPTPLAPPPSSKSQAVKKVMVVILAVLLVGGLVAGGYYIGFTKGTTKGRTDADAAYQKKQADLQKKEAEDSGDITDQDTSTNQAKLELGNLQEPKYVDETLEGTVGKQVSASDGLVLKVTNIERNFKSTDSNYKLDSSKELVKVNFLMGNVTKDKPKDMSSFNFRLENSVNAQLTPENIASYQDKFDTVKLDPGAQSKGSIVYAVNKDEKPLKFVREQRYRISGENREVTTRIVITIAK